MVMWCSGDEPRTDLVDATPVPRVAPEAAVALAGCTITTEETPDGTHLAIVTDSAPDGRVSEGGP